MSAGIAHDEGIADRIDAVLAGLTDELIGASAAARIPGPELVDQALAAVAEIGGELDFRTRLQDTTDNLRKIRRILDGKTGVE